MNDWIWTGTSRQKGKTFTKLLEFEKRERKNEKRKEKISFLMSNSKHMSKPRSEVVNESSQKMDSL